MKLMKNTPLKILISIVLGFAFLRIGFEAKNDNISIIVQSLGYLFVAYPLILFVKVFVNQIIFDIKNRKK